MSGFEGIPTEAVEFYEALELDNSRDWWTAHRELYDTAVRGPMEALAASLEEEFGDAKLFRPYRDVRFSQDKSPYKTHQGVVVATAPGMGWYVQVSAEGLMTAAGWYSGTPGQVASFRESLEDEDAGTGLARIIDTLRAEGRVVEGDRLKTRPRGVDADHPFLDLLRYKTLRVQRQHGTPPWMPTPEASARVRGEWRAYRPLMDWLSAHVGEG